MILNPQPWKVDTSIPTVEFPEDFSLSRISFAAVVEKVKTRHVGWLKCSTDDRADGQWHSTPRNCGPAQTRVVIGGRCGFLAFVCSSILSSLFSALSSRASMDDNSPMYLKERYTPSTMWPNRKTNLYMNQAPLSRERSSSILCQVGFLQSRKSARHE